jgi:hypothetical protein
MYEMKNACKIVGKPEGMGLLGSYGRSWQDNIKIDSNEVVKVQDGFNWIRSVPVSRSILSIGYKEHFSSGQSGESVKLRTRFHYTPLMLDIARWVMVYADICY